MSDSRLALTSVWSKVCFVVAAWSLSACVPGFEKVEAGRVQVQDQLFVSTPVVWNGISKHDRMIWTQNGVGLDELVFYLGLEPGEALIKQSAKAEKTAPMPKVLPDMSPNDMVELVVDSIVRSGGGDVRAIGLRPMPFGALDGYRFDLTYYSDQGLRYRGAVVGAAAGKQQHLILFIAPEQHYYDQAIEGVTEIFESIELAP